MAPIKITWDDVALDHLLNDPDGPVGKDLERRALLVEAEQKKLLSMHGTGRIYTTRFFTRGGKLYSYGKRPAHQASAPNDPPATDTSRLRGSVGHHVGRDQNGLYAHIGSGGNPATPAVKYATMLEYGTRDMQPRPWLRPSEKAADGVHHV